MKLTLTSYAMKSKHSEGKNDSLQMAIRFLEWCRFNLSHYAEKLNPDDRREYELGRISPKLYQVVRKAWSQNLKSNLPWHEKFSVWKLALPDSRDLDKVMNCSMHLLPKLPKRIRNALARAERTRTKEIHDDFFSNGGDEKLTQYLKVSQSCMIAQRKLTIQALGYKSKESGGASIGETEIDIEQMLLTEAEATGSAMKVGHLLPYIRGLWETEKTVLVRKSGVKKISSMAEWEASLERKVIPNPDRSEPRLNRFLIKLGQALADKKKRRVLPDWKHMDQTVRFVVEGWCERIIVDGEQWPPLFLFSTPALAKFLSYCNPPRWQESHDPRTLERAILRLGLVRIQKGRIKRVEKKFGGLHFS
jgi:hypothetical protein